MFDEPSMDFQFIEKLTHILDANLKDERFGVAELAKEIGLSRSQLHRKLRVISGKPTSHFIRNHRLHRAMEMLQNNVATAAEIAYKVGFSSPNYFSSSFKKLYGYPPGEVKFRNLKKNTTVSEESKISGLQILSKPSTAGVKSRTLLYSSIAILVLVSLAYLIYKRTISKVTVVNNNEKSIAVLPFKNFSGDSSMDPFCDGMTDEVIARLTTIESITKVISRTSVFQ